MRRTKANRVLTFVMAAALLIGSIHGVGAKEQSKAYDAPELTLTQGVTDYDLTAGITYDSEKYTLSVTDTGNFDVNVAGDYEISYALTEKESSVNVTESVENTDSVESIENIESTETVSGTETIETTDATATVEDTDQTPEGDATNTVDTQEKQVITFTRTVHVVAASEDEAPEYVARELVLVQGEEGYDLTDEILYDDVKYTLTVGDLGGFDINKIGSYEVTYSLTPVTTEGTQGNGQDDTQENQVITFQRTVTVKAAVEENALYEAPDLYLEWGQEEYDLTEGIIYDKDLYEVKVSDPGDFDIYTLGEYEVTYVLDRLGKSAKAEDTQTSKTEETTASNEDTDNTQTATLELTDEKQSVDPADGDITNSTEEKSSEVKTASQEAVYFTRNVIVEEAGVTYSFRNAVSYANVQGKYTIKLGTPVWIDETHQKFHYTNVKIDTENENITLMTITLSTGKLPNDILSDATLQDTSGKSATWVFANGLSAEEIKNRIQAMVFDYVDNMNVYLTIDGNENKGFESIDRETKLTQWEVNGHYYMYIPKAITWARAYNMALEYKLGGKQGYLSTVTSLDESRYLKNLNNVPTWTSGTRLVYPDNTLITNHQAFKQINANTLKFNSPNGMQNYAHYYWTQGPEAGAQVPSNMWNTGEPNEGGDGGPPMDTTITAVTGKESCVSLETSAGTLNDVYESNRTDGRKVQGLYVEFGGYADGADPGQPDSSKKGEVNVVAAPMDAEASINGVKYAPLADALDTAQAGDTVKIVKDTVTAVTGGTLKIGVQLKSKDGTWFSAPNDAVDVTLDVAADGTVTLKDGTLNVSDNGTLNVYSPVDHNTYKVTTPAGASSVVVPNGTGDDTPYLKNHNTTGELTLKIGDVTYTYSNQSFNAITLVYIPDAMYQNERVTKAEVAADKSAVIKLDDGEENTVEIKGHGSAADKVTVERRTSDKKAEVKLPSGTKAKVFGHEVDTAPAGGVTVGQRNAVDTKYPDRDYIVIAVAGEKVTVDGIEYVATENNQKFYLGTFKAIVTIGSNAEITSGQEQTDVGYLKTYTVKISPKADYDLDQDNFMVTMKESDTGTVKNLTFADVCRVDPADGSITVTIPKVSGDITVNAAAKRQMTTLKVTGLAAGNAKGSFKAVDASGNEYKLEQDGSINVNRNEELTLIFTPNDFSNPYYSDLTGEKGESFSVLTALQDTTNSTDLFAGAKTFNWKEKSYELKYTPTTSDVTLQAVFTPSHIVHVHVTGGTAKVKDTGLVTKEPGADQFQHVIVKNNGTVELELKDTTGTATTYKQAYWSNVDGSDDTIVSNQAFTGNGPSYTYTTRAVGKPRALNITFEEGQTVDVKVTHGTLVTGNDGVAWNDKGNSTYQTIVKNNGALKVNIKPEDGYGLKSITVNNVAIDIDAAIKSGEITWDGTTKTYSHTFAKVYQAWNVTLDFEKLHEIVFEDQKGNILNKTEHITVIDGDTIPAASFTKMQEEADKLKAENESLFVWVDKTDGTKIYNETTVMTAQTADVVTLIPVYRMNVIKGADGSVIAADDFVIHVNDVRKLTDTEAATLANVTAYDHSGSDISNSVTVEQTKLEELKKKTKGTYVDALTFMIAASGLTTGVEVEVTDDNPTITGKTAYTLTFKGRANETYKYQELDAQGTPTGNGSTILTDGDGKATITGLKKATPYQISHKKYGSVNGKTALVDAKDIAKQFEDRGAGDTTGNNATDKTEKAENSNVQVVVDADGNYKVIVKKDIDHTVEIPDTWGEVKIDLNDKTITGDKADDNNEAKPGLEFVKDANSNEHPGTNLEIVNGTIKGGDGSAKHPDGAAGIGASGDTADAGIIIGNNANVTGGNGANGTEGKDGGNGGAGIDGNGKITPTVSGTVTGGNGGKGGNSATDIPGNGGNGGSGISAGDKTITINPGGTVKGGDAGNGGNATGDNTNPGGNGGNGGTGTETTQPGKTDNNGGTTSGGNGGDGGKSDNGNGGNGGNGGSGSTGENNNNGGTSSGGSGGNGGDSDKGNGGSGGNGGSSGETGGTGGDNTGGNGGNGGGSNNGNGGTGGNGGDSNNGTGGNGGNGGDSNNGTGGSGGNGGDSNSGTGGNGGNGGGSDSGTGGNGGNGGDSNSGNGGTGGDGGNGKDPGNGGNGGGSNSGNNGSSGSDGSKPDNNGGNNVGNNNGGNSNGNGGSNGGDNGNNNGGSGSGDNSNGGNGNGGNGSGNNSGNGSNNGSTSGGNSNGNANGTNTGVTDGKTNATDIAATDGNNASGGNKNNKHNRNNRNNNESDQADGEDVTEGTETGADSTDADTGSDDTTDVADSTETGADADGSGNADDSIPADSSDADGHISFADCGSHWYPVILILVIAGYTVLRIRKIREELDGE